MHLTALTVRLHSYPLASIFIFNTYRGWSLLVNCNRSSDSKEGVTQGDPLSMFVYAVATLPLIERIGHHTVGRDAWYAYDTSAAARSKDMVF